MEDKHFSNTDTLHIELYAAAVGGTRDPYETSVLDLYDAGCLCAIPIELASVRMDVPAFSFQQVPSPQRSA